MSTSNNAQNGLQELVYSSAILYDAKTEIATQHNSETSETASFSEKEVSDRIISIVLCFASIYVFLSLLSYAIKTWRMKEVKKINHLTVLCAFFSLLFNLTNLGEYWIGYFSCKFYQWFAAANYVLGLAISYTVLWSRQRCLYRDRLAASSVSKPIKIVSSVLIVLIYCGIGISVLVFQTKFRFQSPYSPCILIWDSLHLVLPISISFMIICFLLQFILYFLIVFPISRLDNTKWKCLLFIKPQNEAEKMAKRLGVCVCACVSSTVVLGATVALDTIENVVVGWSNFAAIDLLINTIATTCALINWRERLFFLCTRTKQGANQVTISSPD